jgi:adenosylhomocysteine nucleosidase
LYRAILRQAYAVNGDPPDRPQRVLMLAPMLSELRPIVKKLSLKRSHNAANSQFYVGQAKTVEVSAAAVGVGPVAAAKATSRLLDSVQVDQVIVCGIAGAVEPDCPIGKVLVPAVVIDGDAGIELYPTGWIGLSLKGTIMTTSTLVTEQASIQELIATGVVALEMEGAGVGRVCEERGVPWTVFRSISDRAGDGAVDESVLSILNEDGSTNVKAAIRQVLGHPGSLPKLMRLAKDSTTAANAAASAAIAALTH